MTTAFGRAELALRSADKYFQERIRDLELRLRAQETKEIPAVAIVGFDEAAQDAVGGALTDSTTIDFTYDDGANTITAIVIDNSITNAKLRDSAGLSVIGRSGSAPGDPADITTTLGSGGVLRESSGTLGFGQIVTSNLMDNVVFNSKLMDMAEATVKGRAAGAGTGDPQDLTAAQLVAVLQTDAAFNEALQDAVGGALTDSTTIDFTYDDGANTITAIVIDGSVTNAKLANMAETTVKGRASGAGTGAPSDLTASQLNVIVGSADLFHTQKIYSGVASDEGRGQMGVPALIVKSNVQLLYRESADSQGPNYEFLKRRSGSGTILQSGDQLGSIAFTGADGNTFGAVGARILAEVDGTPGSTDMPGRILFLTSPDGSATPTEAMRINSRQNVIVADGKRIETDEVRARDAGGLNLFEDGGKGLAIADSTGHVTASDGIRLAIDEVRARDSGGLRLHDDGGNLGIFIEDATGYVGVGTNAPDGSLIKTVGTIGGSGRAAFFLNPTQSGAGGTQYGMLIGGVSASPGADNWIAIGVHGGTVDNQKASLWISHAEATRPGINCGYANTVTAPALGAIIAGAVGIGDSSPDAQLDVVQGDTAGAIPTLELSQSDLSEELINFVGTVAAGNPIDTAAIGTYYGKIRVAVNGTFKYMALYNS